MIAFLFVLGRTPQLAREELRAVFPLSKHIPLTPFCVAMDDHGVTPNQAIRLLGGTVKIAKVLCSLPSLTPSSIARILSEGSLGARITYGISWYIHDTAFPNNLARQVKKELISRGVSARFVQPKQDAAISTVVVKKAGVTELVIAKYNGVFIVGKTVAVQPFEEWNLRDYGRPHADPKKGMLPPKVARMLVNIVHGDNHPFSVQGPRLLLDPFCGMGTIIAEALLRGYRCIGSDQSESAVDRARENIAWLCQRYKEVQDDQVRFFVSDAVHISERVEKSSIDAIVTEPFMGKSDIGERKIKNIVKGLEKMYIGCLKDWYAVVKPGGTVVMALPQYAIGVQTYFVKKVIDSCETLGYTKLLGPIEYSRPQAIVKREFFVFKKN